jgi:glyoxylase-like metal-dependent hydrolase (beta-lactamase superfamily II)
MPISVPQRSLILGSVIWMLAGCAQPPIDTEEVGKASNELTTSSAPVPQQVMPIVNQTSRDPTDTYVAPSATVPLSVGARLDFPSHLGQLVSAPYVVQRLTDRTYWVGLGLYNSVVYVGKTGVLLLDCAGPFGAESGQALISAVATITPLPIKAIAYSHAHTDHVGACTYVKQKFPGVRIIASAGAAYEIEHYGYPLPAPTQVVEAKNGSFEFDGKKFRLVSPVPAAHTLGDAYIVTPDRVLHAVDMVSPGQLPFVNAMNNQNLDGYIEFLRYLAGERDNYDFASWGHFNVGYAKDVDLTLSYFKRLYESWFDSYLATPLTNYVDPSNDNAAVWFRNYYDGISEDLFHRVASDFNYPMIELGRDHAHRVHVFTFEVRFNPATNEPPRLPSFDPIRQHRH